MKYKCITLLFIIKFASEIIIFVSDFSIDFGQSTQTIPGINPYSHCDDMGEAPQMKSPSNLGS